MDELKMEKMREPLGLPKGTVRAYSFLGLVALVIVMTITICIGALMDGLSFEQFKEYLLLVMPLVTMAFGFYFGQKVGK